jgi:small subunit ribosomal protein S5
VRATVKGLQAMQSPARIAAKRGKKTEDLING